MQIMWEERETISDIKNHSKLQHSYSITFDHLKLSRESSEEVSIKTYQEKDL